MSDDSKAQEIFRAIQMTIAGYSAADAIQALLGTLSLLIGMSAWDEEAARKVVDSIPAHLHIAVRENWEHARRLREQSQTHANPGSTRLQ